MKKLIYIVLALISTVFFTQAAFAKEVVDKANYTSLQKPVGESVVASKDYEYEISITNYSSRYVDIFVPVLGFSSTLFPYYVQHIYSENADPKRVIIYSPTRFDPIFDQLVYSYQKIEIYDRLGKLEVTTK